MRINGDLERWLDFFAEAVTVSAARAAQMAQAPVAAESAWAMHEALQRQPVATAALLRAATGLTAATVNKTLVHLQGLEVVQELTARPRGRGSFPTSTVRNC